MPVYLEKLFNRFDGHMREVLKGASSALLIRIIGTLLGFTISVLIARFLGASGSGVYFLALSVATIGATIGRVGFDNTVVRFVASYASTGDWGSVNAVYDIALKVVSAASIVVAIMIFISTPWLANNIFGKPELNIPLIFAALAIPPFSLAMIQAEALRGLRLIPLYQLIATLLISLATLLLLYPLVIYWGTNGAVASYTVAVFLTVICARILWLNAYNKKVLGSQRTIPEIHILPKLLQSSWPLYGVAIMGVVMQQAATIFLGTWGSTQDVGIFNVASRVANLLLFPLFAMISILTPKFAEMYRQGDKQGLKRLAHSSSQILTLVAVSSSIIVAISAEWVLAVFGAEFIDGSTILRILLVSVIVNSATGPAANILMMSGHEYDVRRVMIISVLVMFISCIVFIPSYGSIGAAIAVMTSGIVQNVYMALVVRKEMGFSSIYLFR